MAKRISISINQDISTFFQKVEREAKADFAKIFKRIQRINTPDGEKLSAISGVENEALGTLPIAGGYEIVFCCQDKTNGPYFALFAGTPQEVKAWAQCHIVRINPATKEFQVYQALSAEETKPAPKEEVTQQPPKDASEKDEGLNTTDATTSSPTNEAAPSQGEANEQRAIAEAPNAQAAACLFDAFTEAQLLELGVPQECVTPLKSLETQETFEAFLPHLTEGSVEALKWLLDGEPFDAVLDAYGKEIHDNARSFLVIESDEAMQEVINASLEQWRIFLHPTQKSLVMRPEGMPTLVRGAAGTGKTVVAMHRAVRLSLQDDWKPEDKILFTTYTKNLAADIRMQLDALFTQSGHWNERDRVEVVNLDAWVAGFLRRNRIARRIAYPGSDADTQCWDKAFTLIDTTLGFPETFYQEEWLRVVLPNDIRKEQDYLRVSRKGRGTGLSRRERKLIWPVFDEMRTQLSANGLISIEEACQLAVRLLEKRKGTTEYRAVVVDETQDLDDDALKLLARLALPEGDETKEPHIFLVGDGRQRIYARTGSLSACGINVRGRRSERLRLTYRTTEEIRRAANTILAGERFDDMDEGVESAKGDWARRHGCAPITFVAPDSQSECAWVAKQIESLRERFHLDYRDICVVTSTKQKVDFYESCLEKFGIPGVELSRNVSDNQTEQGVRFATMHRTKGLEFRVIFIVDAGTPTFPAAAISEDPVEQHRMALTERSLRYVAATRAKDALFVSAVGEAPKWMKALETTKA